MKIINYGKHDYYDSAMAYLSEPDNSCIYDRKNKSIFLKEFDLLRISRAYDIRTSKVSTIKPYVLFFCGKTYPLLKISSSDPNVKDLYAYSYDEYVSLLDKNNLELNKTRSSSFFFSRNLLSDSGVKSFFELENKDPYNLHHRYNCPCLLLEFSYGGNKNEVHKWQYKITLNPMLKDISFVRILPPTEAFQEIYMYLGGVLTNNEDKTLKISDEIKRDQKGFDKYSFKTMKGQKKPRRKNKKEKDE